MSFRIVPDSGFADSVGRGTVTGAPSAVGVHDTLRHGGVLSHASEHNDRHPLEARLAGWDRTRDEMQMEAMRRVYGLGEPVRRGMELHVAKLGWTPSVMGNAPVGLEVLKGTDTQLSVDDVYPGGVASMGRNKVGGFHDEMERGLARARQF
ncbi:hypothetical protein PYCC9005_005612 [Savitreella phatthalungensis]